MARSRNTPLPTAPAPEPRTQEMITQDDVGAMPPSLLAPAPIPGAAKAFLAEVKGPVDQPSVVPIITIEHADSKFMMPSAELVDQIEGYPIYYFHSRRFYKKPPAGGNTKGTPPDCWSGDMLSPHRDSLEQQSELCSTCKWNEFGSARDGKSKACGTRTYLFLLNPAFGNPPLMMIDIPPSSLRTLIGNRFKGGYFSQAMARHGCYQIVWSRFRLVSGGDIHSIIVPSMGHCAPEKEAVEIARFRNKFIPMMDALRGVPIATGGAEVDEE